MALAEEHLAVERQEEGEGLFLLGPLLPRACQSPTSLFNMISSSILSLLKIQNAMMVFTGFLEFNCNQCEN